MTRPETEGQAIYNTKDGRAAVRTRLVSMADSMSYLQHPRYPFVEALRTNFATLPIDWKIFWNDPRRIHAMIPTIFSATNMAFHAVNERFLTDGELEKPDYCRKIITDVATNPATQDVFNQELMRFPVSFSPTRAIPYYFIMQHMSKEEPNRPLALVDLGAASGYMLPSMNSDITLGTMTRAPEGTIQHSFGLRGEIPIACGISVDILSQDEAILRSKANSDERVRRNLDDFFRSVDKQTFPFIQSDVREMDPSLTKIKSVLEKYGRNQADVVLSSWVEYQLIKDKDKKMFRDYYDFVLGLLSVGGILISVGDEMFEEDYDISTFSVNVFQKKDANNLEYLGIPYFISDDGKIGRFSSGYFATALSNSDRRVPAYPNVGFVDIYGM